MKSTNVKNKFLVTALFMLIITSARAQNSQVLYFMNLPQNHLLNPALRPTNSVYIGLPALTGISINIKNNFFNFSDVFSEGLDVNKSTIPFLQPDFDTEKFLSRLKKSNYLEPTASVQLLGVGLNAGRDLYVFLDIVDNIDVNIAFPRDLMRLAFLGNEAFIGQTFDLSDLRADYKYYREIGIGASKKITPKLRFGAKAKLLFGISAGSFQNYGLNLTVNNDFSNTLDANMAFDISGPFQFYTDSENHIEDAKFDNERFNTSKGTIRFLTNTRNAGFGIDLGAEYAVYDRILISAAITDIGFIKWKSDLSNLEAVGNVEVSGMDFKDIYEETATIDEVAGNLIDSLKQVFHVAGTEKPFTTKLPVGIAIGGKYNLNEKFSIGVLSYSRIIGQQIKEALTVSANMNIGNSVSTTLAYTACNHNYNNLGLGLGFRASVFQFYFLLDRIPLSWEKAGSGNKSATLPSNWNTIHTRFGMNLVFGNKARNNM